MPSRALVFIAGVTLLIVGTIAMDTSSWIDIFIKGLLILLGLFLIVKSFEVYDYEADINEFYIYWGPTEKDKDDDDPFNMN